MLGPGSLHEDYRAKQRSSRVGHRSEQSLGAPLAGVGGLGGLGATSGQLPSPTPSSDAVSAGCPDTSWEVES